MLIRHHLHHRRAASLARAAARPSSGQGEPYRPDRVRFVIRMRAGPPRTERSRPSASPRRTAGMKEGERRSNPASNRPWFAVLALSEP